MQRPERPELSRSSKDPTRPAPAPHGPQREPWWSWWHAVELVCTFLVFAGVMHFIYAEPPGTPWENIGAPGNDSFYHIKMAALLPEIGLIDTFPWLRTTVFYDKFVNHHYGFQLLLSPFVHLAKRLTGDYAAGGRWFITLSFGLSMACFNLLLMARRIERRWIWLALCLLLPAQFYGRHAFVRAISPSLVCMLLLCLCMFRRRYLLAGIVVALSIQVYLGAVTFAPVLVIAYVLAGLVGLIGDRILEGAPAERLIRDLRGFDGWRLAFWTLAGWVVGLALHPYGGLDVLSFLKLQVFGSGLTPEIDVGREWKSYSPAWFFANMSGVTLIATGIAICLRMRFGQRLRTDELALLIMNGVFLGLTFKARRFIEYWPLFSTLNAAYLAGPLLGPRRQAQPSAEEGGPTSRAETPATIATAVVTILICGVAARLSAAYVPDVFAAEWRFWALLGGLFVLVPIVHYTGGRGVRRSMAWAIAGAGIFCGAIAVMAQLFAPGEQVPPTRIPLGWMPFAALLVAYVVCAAVAGRGTPRRPNFAARAPVAMAAAVAIGAAVLIPAGALLGALQGDVHCKYDLPAIREVMQKLEQVSNKGDIVFTDDWDIFPVYFYMNHHNHYIVGLDPKFSHEKDPVLWERYVRISRGEVPATRTVDTVEDGKLVTCKIMVELRDIRTYFGARFVVVDRDHRALARKLDAAPALAECIFPEDPSERARAPYLLYRILPEPNGDSTKQPE
jgi:hypothetical protein